MSEAVESTPGCEFQEVRRTRMLLVAPWGFRAPRAIWALDRLEDSRPRQSRSPADTSVCRSELFGLAMSILLVALQASAAQAP